MRICFLLGAGFSIPAGIKGGKELNKIFIEPIEGKLIINPDSSMNFDPQGNPDPVSGVPVDIISLKIGLFLTTLIEEYSKNSYSEFNYEEFYDELNCYDFNSLQLMLEKTNFKIKSRGHLFKLSESEIDINFKNKLVASYNYIIKYLITPRADGYQNINLYLEFLNLVCNSCDSLIFSLNHDLLVEDLLDGKGVKFSDGFSKTYSNLIGQNDDPLRTFQNEFESKIKLFKLHGSIDTWKYEEEIKVGDFIYSKTGEIQYYKSLQNLNIHYVRKIDRNSKKVIQQFSSLYHPQFLTGKSKLNIINNNKMYNELYMKFIDSFQLIDKLIIIGYSFHDCHIENILKESVNKYDFDILNVNISEHFPYIRKDGMKPIVNIEHF